MKTGESQHSSVATITHTSSDLLRQLRSPEHRGTWDEFVGRYRPIIVGFGRRLGLKHSDAEDAAQQTLFAFYEAFQDNGYDPERGRLRSWLFGIATNQIRNHRRKLGKHEVQIPDDSRQTGLIERIPDADRLELVWEDEWQQAVLAQCLEEVRQVFSAKTVEAFRLFALEGWPARKVAENLEMKTNAVFLAKRRVLKKLQELQPVMEEAW